MLMKKTSIIDSFKDHETTGIKRAIIEGLT